MNTHFVSTDRSTPLLLPPDMRDWVRDDDPVHFVLEAVRELPLSTFHYNRRGTGSPQYEPRMMLALLIYCYSHGIFSSRRIEGATYRDVAVRYLTADQHPDHDSICKFRRENFAAVEAAFLRVLQLARELGLLKVGCVSVDGTHIKANAAKYRSVSYRRAGELDAKLQQDIAGLLAQAEAADSQPPPPDDRLPRTLQQRQALQAKLRQARATLEERARDQAAGEQDAYQARVRERAAREPQRRGRHPVPPCDTPQPAATINLTDPDSRLMRKGKHGDYTQSYNAQAAVDAEGSQLILGHHLGQSPADHGELLPGVASIPAELGAPHAVLADSGYVNLEAFATLASQGVEPYVAVSRGDTGLRRYDFREQAPPPGKTIKDPRLLAMQAKLQSDHGKALYARRKQTVEPVFGIIKEVLGFRQFHLRGHAKVSGEWALVCLAYNCKRLHRLQAA